MPYSAISSFVSNFVRVVAYDERKRHHVVRTLESGKPYVENIHAAVIIEVVAEYGGDIVKFLGDAILAVFSEGEMPSLGESIERAIRCCASIMLKYPSVTLDTSLVHQMLISANEFQSTSHELTSGGPPQKGLARSRIFTTAQKLHAGKSANIEDTHLHLRLHMAVTSGVVSRVILGNTSKRMDFVVYGNAFSEFNGLLSLAKAGEVAVNRETWDIFLSDSRLIKNCEAMPRQNASAVVFGYDFIKSLFGNCLDPPGILPGSLPPYIHEGASKRVMSTFSGVETTRRKASEATDRRDEDEASAEAEEFLEKFVNESILYKLKLGDAKRTQLAGSNNRGSGTMHLSESLQTGKDSGPYGHEVQSEFRTISVVFAKLDGEFDPIVAQQAMVEFVEALQTYGGVFQQYSVDDKGQTMLACFGLPV
ncbi:hypothetical protein HDU67_006683 [Dinochytrium kinnereticum]|nr:hypothetical protein HDU67_006683 [Dinochytrium kinnereticum]